MSSCQATKQSTLVQLFPEIAFGNCKYRFKNEKGLICTYLEKLGAGFICENPSDELHCGWWEARNKNKGPFYWNSSGKTHFMPAPDYEAIEKEKNEWKFKKHESMRAYQPNFKKLVDLGYVPWLCTVNSISVSWYHDHGIDICHVCRNDRDWCKGRLRAYKEGF